MARSVSLQALILLFVALLSLVSGWDVDNQNDRHGCQAYSEDPIDGCDRERTLFVDVVSSTSKYKTVQSGKTYSHSYSSSRELIEAKLWHHCQTTLVE